MDDGIRPGLLGMAQVVQPETILRWHRAGFKAFWRWKSQKRAGRPKIDRGLRDLIRRMSKENTQWGASRIHGELLMLGFEVAQSTVSKYMVRGGTPPSQSWKTFLLNHAQAIAAIDLCVVPTLTFERLFAFLVLGHGRRQLLWFEVTLHPTAEWLASAPAYLVRDNDRAYGDVLKSRASAPKTTSVQESAMTDRDNRAALNQHWAASDANEYVILYDGQPSYTVSIMEFEGGKVARETQYFGDPFEASAWRSRWVEPME